MPSATLKGKVVVITGASSGIGRACALAFARQEAHVVIAARRTDRLTQVRAEVERLGARCLAITVDVSDPDQVEALAGAAIEQFGGIDVWVNNAGYGLAASLEQTSPEEMRRIWDVNFMGAFYGARAALPQMRRQGRGVIINVSSLAGRLSMPLGAAYSATKAALNALSEALDMELEGSGIRVCSLLVGFTETEFFHSMVKKIPEGRSFGGPIATAESVAEVVVKSARRPRPSVVFLPGSRLTLALLDLAPGLYRRMALYYIRVRTNGAGVPRPEA